jgi:transaldolase
VHGSYEQARADLDALAAVGVSYDDVVRVLEEEGVEKFEAAWNELLDSTKAELERLAPSEA